MECFCLRISLALVIFLQVGHVYGCRARRSIVLGTKDFACIYVSVAMPRPSQLSRSHRLSRRREGSNISLICSQVDLRDSSTSSLCTDL